MDCFSLLISEFVVMARFLALTSVFDVNLCFRLLVPTVDSSFDFDLDFCV